MKGTNIKMCTCNCHNKTDRHCNNCEYGEFNTMYMRFDHKTADEARQYAIDWQNWQAEQSLSYKDLIGWQELFSTIAFKFNLTEEFKENGIL